MNANVQLSFHEAVKNNDVETARRMIAAGADVNAPDDSDWHPLRSACCNGYYELVRLLVESGADVNVQDKDGSTPLMECVHCFECVKIILEAGAKANVRDKYGNTPLLSANLHCIPGVIKLLLKAGAKVNVRSSEDFETPYNLAIRERDFCVNETAQECIKSKCD